MSAAQMRRRAQPTRSVQMRKLAWMAGLLLCFACNRGAKEVVVYTSVDQPFSEPPFKEFEKRSGIKVLAVYDTEETKSTASLNRLIAEAQQTQAYAVSSGDAAVPVLL